MKPLAFLSTIVVAGSLAMVACSGTTAEDRERLELLKSDPLFDYAPPGQTPDDFTSSIDVLADGDDPISDVTGTFHSVWFALGPSDDHFSIMREAEALMVEQGWQELVAQCLEFEITVRGAKSSDGFRALGGFTLSPEFHRVDGEQTSGPGLRITMSAPFHSEDGGPIEGHRPDTDGLHQTDD